ncbi:histidine kinase [Nocardiopsis sp. YSL2]|uniref:histidine kinase n=1 Tax=Nocardiopsis sp. YSL2 TaxID=2939492 RepID=UPI0026F47DF9|nr:histidine kinase [Nocardiopsis sp. YSL2]
MRVLPARPPWSHAGLACVVAMGLLALWWPLLVIALPVPALLTGRLSEDPRPAVTVYFTGVVAGTVWLVLSTQPLGIWVTGSALVLFAVLLPWLVGLYLRSTSTLEQAGWERARTLEREARLVAERARMRERSRIAQDLHDEVGHELSLLSLRAGGLQMAPDLSEERQAQAKELREAAGRAAEQIMEAVGVLRADADPAPLDPTGGGIRTLVERARASGMDVALEQQEEESGDLPVMVDHAVRRVVQEALTNAAKHTPGAALRVVVSRTSDEVSVLVSETSSQQRRTEHTAPGAPGTGTGLVSLRERVRLVGGSLEAGKDETGWTVSARIPLRGSVAGSRSGGDPRTAAEPSPKAGRFRGAPVAPILREPHPDVAPYRRARRLVGWAIAAVVGLPVGAALTGYGLTVALATHQAATATLDPSVFEELEPGRPRAEVEAVLPEGDLYRTPFGERERPDGPDGLECVYYRSNDDVFGGGYETYRLCFDTEVLVSAETLVR